MWNKVSAVAKHNNLPAADLVDFALSRDTKYKIEVVRGDAMVSNFRVEELIADFERMQAEEDEAEVEYICNNYPHLAHHSAIDVGCEFDPKLG